MRSSCPPPVLSVPRGSGPRRAALGCPLVTLHSPGRTNASQAELPSSAVDLIAIDMPESAQLRLPGLETSRLLAGRSSSGGPM